MTRGGGARRPGCPQAARDFGEGAGFRGVMFGRGFKHHVNNSTLSGRSGNLSATGTTAYARVLDICDHVKRLP